MGPSKILAPAGGMLATLAWLLASLEKVLWKIWIFYYKHTHTQTLENFIIRFIHMVTSCWKTMLTIAPLFEGMFIPKWMYSLIMIEDILQHFWRHANVMFDVWKNVFTVINHCVWRHANIISKICLHV